MILRDARKLPAAAGLIGALLLTGCSSLPGDYYATDVDLSHAQHVWSDPWVAPGQLAVPGAGYGSNGLVRRTAGIRSTTYVGLRAVPAALQEVTTAGSAGWQLVGATCDDDRVVAVLTTGGTEVGEAAVARVVAEENTRSQPYAVTAVGVTVEVPHHLDEDWPDLGAAVPPDETCLAGAAAAHPAPELPDGEPRGPVDDGVDGPEWSDDGPTTDDQARMDAVSADAWFAAQQAAAFDPDTAGGDQGRHAPSAGGTMTPGPAQPTAAIAAAVDDMDGWVLTYAGCSPHTGAVATLRLDTDAGPVTARLEAVPRQQGAVTWRVSVPVVDGPDQTWIDQVAALESPTCLAGTSAPTTPVIDGIPVGVPGEQQPLQE